MKKVNSTNILGVIIDENLYLQNHFDAIAIPKTVSGNIGMLYCTVVLPDVIYGILIIQGNTYKVFIKFSNCRSGQFGLCHLSTTGVTEAHYLRIQSSNCF